MVVPLHELLHAAGCLLTGGSVERLELRSLWGGRLLARVLPWVTPGGSYAGRLSGFHPAGDLSYLATVLLPHALLAPVGALACRSAARRARPFVFGAALLAAGQPLASLSGDFYEAASIPLTAVAKTLGASWAPLLRGDDLVLVGRAALRSGRPGALVLFALGTLLGGALALFTLWMSGGVAPKVRGEDMQDSPNRPSAGG